LASVLVKRLIELEMYKYNKDEKLILEMTIPEEEIDQMISNKYPS
jgi:hypothetical protein